MITNQKSEISNKKYITKAIQDNGATEHKHRLIIQRVQRVNLDCIEDKFYPSFFQEEISKLYEIRTFYFLENCYSIKFSSNSKNIDMRDSYNELHYESY